MTRLLQPGRNCWRIERAGRFALLVDASNYYGTLLRTLPRAEQTIALLAWDFDTRTELFEHDPAAGSGPLEQFLNDLVNRNQELHVYLLPWNFPLLFAHVRDPKLVRGEDPFEHPRIHFKMDDAHPPGGSHHQKILIVDRKLAFSGGIDLAGGRWDTPEHCASDPRRGTGEDAYPASHDVQAMVDGPAAAALADLFDERWQRATHEAPHHAEPTATDLWPAETKPDLTNIDIAISRTDPRIPRHEVEQLHLDLIAAARDLLYIENQYLTSPLMVDALCRRLQEADGPEIVMVLPLNNHGWMEEHTMEVLRFRQIRRLRESDRYGRLRICYPTVRGLESEDESIVVHSKILAVDDRFFRIGSSNLTDRSMRLDTECDLAIEAEDRDQRAGIARLRNRLIGEHLGLAVETVEASLRERGSAVRLIDSCSTQPRCLRELPGDGSATQILSSPLIDPAQPLTPEFVAATLADSAARNRWVLLLAGLAVGALIGRFLRRS